MLDHVKADRFLVSPSPRFRRVGVTLIARDEVGDDYMMVPSSMTLRGFLSKVNPRQTGGGPPFDSPPRLATVPSPFTEPASRCRGRPTI